MLGDDMTGYLFESCPFLALDGRPRLFFIKMEVGIQ